MLQLWKKLRIFFLLAVFLGLGFFLIATTPWQRLLGITRPYADYTKEGQPLVDALYHYHADNNLWPQYAEDLTPQYLPAIPPGWYFTLDDSGPSLAKLTDQPHTYVGFDFDPNHPHWRVFGSAENKILADLTASPTTHPAQPPPDQIISHELAALDLRIAREPREIDHRRAKASLLKSLGRTQEANAVIAAAEKDLPQNFWPRLAAAALAPQKIPAFADWVQANPTFTHFYYLALLYRTAGETEKMRTALAAALAEKPELAPDDPLILPAYFYDMARSSLAAGDDPLTIQITNAWQQSQKNLPHHELSFLPLRAAAELHQGNFPAAAQDLSTLGDNQNLWAKNLEPLKSAVQNHNPTFPYNPGPLPPPYEIFSLPQ